MDDNKKEMRKLKIQVQMSMDGCIAGPNNEMDWLVWNWDEKLRICKQVASASRYHSSGKKNDK